MKDISDKDKYPAELRKKLESFYSGKKFYDGLLHESCEHAEECWKRLENKVKDASEWNFFSLPYIGKKYNGKLVCVGLNVHEGGGRNLQEMQIRGIKAFKTDKKCHKNDIYGDKYDPGVIESLERGCKSVKFENGMKKMGVSYGGTLLWHRIAVYSKILLDGYNSNVADNFKELAEIYEHIIYMDAIKCSPARNRSKPTRKMEKDCPEYIFFKELKIIKPKNILIMSKPVARLMMENYKPIGRSEDFPRSGKDVDHCKIKIEEGNVDVYYVVHPGTRGRGSRTDLFQELANIIPKK